MRGERYAAEKAKAEQGRDRCEACIGHNQHSSVCASYAAILCSDLAGDFSFFGSAGKRNVWSNIGYFASCCRYRRDSYKAQADGRAGGGGDMDRRRIDFRGVNPKSFDGRGNYSIGMKEQLIFPEIEYDKVEKVRGMDIIIVTTAKTDEEARELLTLLGMPFSAK